MIRDESGPIDIPKPKNQSITLEPEIQDWEKQKKNIKKKIKGMFYIIDI